jgi:hypothetical protein
MTPLRKFLELTSRDLKLSLGNLFRNLLRRLCGNSVFRRHKGDDSFKESSSPF